MYIYNIVSCEPTPLWRFGWLSWPQSSQSACRYFYTAVSMQSALFRLIETRINVTFALWASASISMYDSLNVTSMYDSLNVKPMIVTKGYKMTLNQ